MRRISKRLEVLERAADTEIFANAFPFAVAYYLGGARDLSDVVHGYARALGYKDLVEFIRASAYLLLQPSDSVDEPAAHEARIHRARSELLTKFGYDLRRARPAALDDAAYRIVRTLPEEWLASLKSGHRKSLEDEARATQFHKVLMQLAESVSTVGVPDGAESTQAIAAQASLTQLRNYRVFTQNRSQAAREYVTARDERRSVHRSPRLEGRRSGVICSGSALVRAGTRGRFEWTLKSGKRARRRRAQTFLRALGIDITFTRGGRDGSRIIRMRAHSKVPSAPSAPSAFPDPRSEQTAAAMDI